MIERNHDYKTNIFHKEKEKVKINLTDRILDGSSMYLSCNCDWIFAYLASTIKKCDGEPTAGFGIKISVAVDSCTINEKQKQLK